MLSISFLALLQRHYHSLWHTLKSGTEYKITMVLPALLVLRQLWYMGVGCNKTKYLHLWEGMEDLQPSCGNY